MWAVILAVLAAICWGIAPVAAKLALNQVSPIVGMAVRSLIAMTLVSTWLVATGHYKLAADLKSSAMVWLLLEAILATVVGDALYFYALKHGKAGEVGIIMASSPIITVLAADLLLGEPSTPTKLFGVALVIGGLILASK